MQNPILLYPRRRDHRKREERSQPSPKIGNNRFEMSEEDEEKLDTIDETDSSLDFEKEINDEDFNKRFARAVLNENNEYEPYQHDEGNWSNSFGDVVAYLSRGCDSGDSLASGARRKREEFHSGNSLASNACSNLDRKLSPKPLRRKLSRFLK